MNGTVELPNRLSPPSPDPLEGWHQSDPLLRMVNLVVENGAATHGDLLDLDTRILAEVAAATEKARAAQFPPAADAYAHIYAGGDLWPH